MSEQGFDLARFWLEGGAVMYPILLLGLVAETVAVVALLTRSSGVALAALALAALPLCLGVVGRAQGRRGTDQALAMVSPEHQEAIRAAGYAESERPLQLGGVLTLLTLPTAAAGFAVSRRRPGAAPVKRLD